MVPCLCFLYRRWAAWPVIALWAVAALCTGCATSPVFHDPRVVVMNFQNTIGDHSAMNYTQSLAEMMTSCLANYPRVAIVDRQEMDDLSGKIRKDPSNWQKLARRAGIDYMIVGSIGRLDRNYIVNARLLSVATGDVVRGSSVTRYCKREEDLYPVIQAMSRILGDNLKYLAEYFEALTRGAPAPLKVEPAFAPAATAAPAGESQ